MSAVTTHIDVIVTCGHIVDGQRIVPDIIARTNYHGIIVFTLTPAELYAVELQFVGLVTVVDYLYTSVSRHHNLVPVFRVTIACAILVA